MLLKTKRDIKERGIDAEQDPVRLWLQEAFVPIPASMKPSLSFKEQNSLLIKEAAMKPPEAEAHQN